MSALASSMALEAYWSAWRTVVSLAAHVDVVRPQPVHQLVHQDVGEEGVERDVPPVLRGQRHLGDGQEHTLELGLLHVLEHHALVALLGADTLVVGQVEGGRLHTRGWRRPRRTRTLTTRMGDSPPSFGLRIFASMGRCVLETLQLAAELGQLLRLGVIAQGDEGLEGGLVVEPVVLVDLVGPDGRLDAGVQLHPRHVAGVVVVGEEGVRAGSRERP